MHYKSMLCIYVKCYALNEEQIYKNLQALSKLVFKYLTKKLYKENIHYPCFNFFHFLGISIVIKLSNIFL